MRCSSRPARTRRRDPRPAAAEWRRKCGFVLRSAMSHDDKVPPGWCRHVHYDALMADPVGTVRELYRGFGDELSDYASRYGVRPER
ncbi:MAG TPA: sulfotransferase [Streptosporangiaceae bacterium]|nr:sulfotransferase [Streptosporangiaceae bacterium]